MTDQAQQQTGTTGAGPIVTGWNLTGFDPADPFEAELTLKLDNGVAATIPLTPARTKQLHSVMVEVLDAQAGFFGAEPTPGSPHVVAEPVTDDDTYDDLGEAEEPLDQAHGTHPDDPDLSDTDLPDTDHPWGVTMPPTTVTKPAPRTAAGKGTQRKARGQDSRRPFYRRPTQEERNSWSVWRRHKFFTFIVVVLSIAVVLGFVQTATSTTIPW